MLAGGRAWRWGCWCDPWKTVALGCFSCHRGTTKSSSLLIICSNKSTIFWVAYFEKHPCIVILVVFWLQHRPHLLICLPMARQKTWGKTSLVRRYMYDTFEEGTAPTVGADGTVVCGTPCRALNKMLCATQTKRWTKNRSLTRLETITAAYCWKCGLIGCNFFAGMDFQSKTAYLESVQCLWQCRTFGSVRIDICNRADHKCANCNRAVSCSFYPSCCGLGTIPSTATLGYCWPGEPTVSLFELVR